MRVQTGPRNCACLDFASLATRHSDWGFDLELFDLALDGIEVVDRAPLDEYLSDSGLEEAWGGRGIFIYSVDRIGCGKTFLSHYIAARIYGWGARNNRVDSSYRAWYMLMSEFADRAFPRGRDGFKYEIPGDNEFAAEHIDLWNTPGVFVLDELGREGLVDSRKVQEARAILESFMRDRIGRPTIVVSHTHPRDVHQIVSDQTVSIMSKMPVVEVTGEDKRRMVGSPFYE